MKNTTSTFLGKTLLITDGTGSFGHVLLDRFLDMDVHEISIFSRDEKKQDDMRTEYGNNPKIKFYIGDVRDLNYEKYFDNGTLKETIIKEFNSDNTELLDIEAVKQKLMSLKYIKEELDALK